MATLYESNGRYKPLLSPDGVAPAELLSRDKRDEYVNWLIAQPFLAKYKEQLLQGFGVQFGVRFSTVTYQDVRATGIDRH